MALLPDDENFDKRWLHQSTQDHNRSVIANLNEVREFAYKSFDRLDKDGNAYIEMSELTDVLAGGQLDNREKSFVLFLLNNHEQIASMSGVTEKPAGISRNDIEQYFSLLANLI